MGHAQARPNDEALYHIPTAAYSPCVGNGCRHTAHTVDIQLSVYDASITEMYM